MALRKKSPDNKKPQVAQPKTSFPEKPLDYANRPTDAAALIQRAVFAAQSPSLSHNDLLTLQRTCGNQAVNKIITHHHPGLRSRPVHPVQAGRAIGPADDALVPAQQQNPLVKYINRPTLVNEKLQTKLLIQRGYDRTTNKWEGKKRPPQPQPVQTAMTQANQQDPLKGHTAHHKIDYAQIRNEILDALAPTGNVPKLKNIAEFAGIKLSTDITGELNLPLGNRSQKFEKAVNNFMKQALWTPWDIFPGVLSEERADDPTKTGASVDMHFTSSGHTTPKSELARDITLQGGFGGVDPAELNKRLNALVDKKPSGYDPKEWVSLPSKTTKKNKTLAQYRQKNDPQNWDGPQCEIVFPKANETLQSDHYTLRIWANPKTNNVQVKIQRVGTEGTWMQARQTSEGSWWFDWSSIEPGQYEIMAKAWSKDDKDWVSRHIRVSRPA